MPRPTRAVSKVKTYAESEPSDVESDVDDGSFDEDDDPDNIEVPGGGKTLEAAVQRGKEDDDDEDKIDPKVVSGVKLPDVLKQEPSASSSTQRLGNSQSYLSSSFPFHGNHSSNSNAAMFPPQLGNDSSPVNPFVNLFGPNSPYLKLLSDPTQAFQQLYSALLVGAGPARLRDYEPVQFPNLPLNPPRLGIPNKLPTSLQNMIKIEPGEQGLEEEEVDNQEDEAMGVAETYSEYKPAKLKIGKRHPDQVVETASLASVAPPEVTYKLHLPASLIDKGLLSALQLEAVTYACQQHEFILESRERAGYLIGDGAGVGKGRTIAGIIYENYLCGRKKAIWVSVSNDLKYDSDRDMKDIGAKIDITALNKLKYGKIPPSLQGVIFSTYSSLIGESSLSGKYNTRLKQLIHWFGENYEGCIVFDECHRAKNLCAIGSSKPTKTGLTVHELQKRLPRARIVYASATGASEPRNMAYMTRLGIWGAGTPFPEFTDFIHAVEKRGVGAMEIVAMDMKLRGAYIARQLSFHGVNFNVDEVPLVPEFVKTYDASVQLWVELMQRFIEAAELMQSDVRQRKAMWAQFWSSHQRFFKYLCIASKVKQAVNLASEAVKLGKCVVIGLQSTGEARTLDQLEKDDGELNDFVSTAKGVLQSLVEKHFPSNVSYRVAKIVEAATANSKLWEELMDDTEQSSSAAAGGSNNSSNKRKPMRRAAQKAVKRVRVDSESDSDAPPPDDSDFEMSDKDGNSSESYTSDSSASKSPTHDDDDDEDEMYGGSRKKAKDKKATVAKNLNKPGDDRKPVKPSPGAVAKADEMRRDLLAKIDSLGERLPPNALDQLIDELGGPDDVAEMTGRKGRVIQTEDGQILYESRSEVDVSLETINLTEKQRFMDGVKKIAIISEAASSGISLQSDKRAKNTLRRVHITLELPWSADRAIQQFGRTHRSNQVNAPEYVFLISDLAGEHRFASIVAKRLESLGALTHGDRRATETRDLSRFHIDTKYGREALEHVMKAIMEYEKPMVDPPGDYPDHRTFFEEIRGALLGVGLIVNSEENRGIIVLDKEHNNMSKFLNRILGMPVRSQNALFQFFTDTLQHVVNTAKRLGRFDLGILDLGDSGSGALKRLSVNTYYQKHATGRGKIELHRLLVERGLNWTDAMIKYQDLSDDKEGFYLLRQKRNDKRIAILAIAEESVKVESGKKEKGKTMYTIYRPSTGLQMRKETWKELNSKYEKLEPELVKASWENQFLSSKTTCAHAFWRGNCKARTLGIDCDVGRRTREYNVLSGSVLMVWALVEKLVITKHQLSSKMQVVRVRDTDLKLVGVLIPNHCVHELKNELSQTSEECEELKFTD
ncbi:unnamed protein product [Allacma fusca]|uniref:Protein strawberry notch n=1 Tax=Allacma fusca TaxID=39272 RepID=A0A8J2KBC2_9HEXA|nr:unnamed protein product [Allacma fusca]